MNRYMHLLDGKPAYFDGEQLVYASRFDSYMTAERLFVNDLRTIRRQQQQTMEYRSSLRWEPTGMYDYLRIKF